MLFKQPRSKWRKIWRFQPCWWLRDSLEAVKAAVAMMKPEAALRSFWQISISDAVMCIFVLCPRNFLRRRRRFCTRARPCAAISLQAVCIATATQVLQDSDSLQEAQICFLDFLNCLFSRWTPSAEEAPKGLEIRACKDIGIVEGDFIILMTGKAKRQEPAEQAGPHRLKVC